MELRNPILSLRLLSTALALAVLLSSSFSLAHSSGKQTGGGQSRIWHNTLNNQELQLRRIEEAAALFIQRWQETLDFETVFNEMYVSNPLQRRRNIYSWIRSGPDNYKHEKQIDSALMKDAFIGFFNMWYLGEEYSLTLPKDADHQESYPREIGRSIKEIRRELKKLKKNGQRNTAEELRTFATRIHYVNLEFRKYLPANVFNSPIYLENLKASVDESTPPRLLLGVPSFGIDNDQEVYVVKRGVFEFCFIEEGGKFKVLTLIVWSD